MAFIKTIPEDQAEGLVQKNYEINRQNFGIVPNHAKVFSLRPEAYAAWLTLSSAVRSKMRLRRYELVTFAAAMQLRCTYCMLAHGSVLHKNFFSVDQMAAIVRDFRNAGLSDEEVALMAFAQKMSANAGAVSEDDIQELRGFGLSDEEILDVVLTAAIRNFFSKSIDALGAVPDDIYLELEPELVKVLAIGRPFPDEE